VKTSTTRELRAAGDLRLIFWGYFDKSMPRVRILLQGLQEQQSNLLEIGSRVWEGHSRTRDIGGMWERLWMLLRLAAGYPALIWRYLRAPAHDVVVVSYPGHMDVLVLWPWARIRGARIVWDAFLSVHNTVVEDRRLFRPWNPVSLALWVWEWLGCHAADLIILDTSAHADLFRRKYRIKASRLAAAHVGAEPERFSWQPPPRGQMPVILFYGTFIPIHGLETILEAARLAAHRPIRWILIGDGQERPKVRAWMQTHKLPHLEWIPQVPYEELNRWLGQATVCLGIFGDSIKAASVVPNKVYQAILAGKPIVTRDSPAVRELMREGGEDIRLVRPCDPNALLAAVEELVSRTWDSPCHAHLAGHVTPRSVAGRFLSALDQLRANPIERQGLDVA
jgi:glycosyltransferase involved in cell wall biosynthesis